MPSESAATPEQWRAAYEAKIGDLARETLRTTTSSVTTIIRGRPTVPSESAAPKTLAIKCGQCQQPMTIDEFFSDDHPCLTDPEKTIDEAMREWNL